MSVAPAGEAQPLVVSTTLQCISVPGEPASKTIWCVVCPAVIVPPVSVHAYVDPAWLGTLADAPEAPTGTETGAVMTGCAGTGVTVTVTVGAFVDAQGGTDAE